MQYKNISFYKNNAANKQKVKNYIKNIRKTKSRPHLPFFSREKVDAAKRMTARKSEP